jgi:hypothetical protein
MILDEDLYLKHIGKPVLLDANLLLVLLSGMLGTTFFASFERVKNDYTFADYELLLNLISQFRGLITTPHILTEVSNLANKLHGTYRDAWYRKLAGFVSIGQGNSSVSEIWEPPKEFVTMAEFIKFGITDCVVARFASGGLVVTADGRLSSTLRSKGIDVLNFNELRMMQKRIQ